MRDRNCAIHIWTFIFVSALVAAVACVMEGTRVTRERVVEKADGTVETEKTEVVTTDSKEATNVDLPGTKIKVSPTYKPPKEDIVAKTTVKRSMTYAIILTVACIASIYVRAKYQPLIPSTVPVALGLAAGAFYAGPTIVDRYSGQILIAAGGFAVWSIWSFLHNRKLAKQDPALLKKP